MTKQPDGAVEAQDVTPDGRSVRRRKLRRRKKLLFATIICIVGLLLVEIGARLVLYVRHDFNPFYLTFGFVTSIEASAHSNNRAGYSKFKPNQTKHQKCYGRTFSVRINSDGFRSRDDFVRPKPEGVYRIVALGGSSTFGMYVEDDQTYPYQLERMLREAVRRQNIEVYNLGVPHAISSNVLALARSELPSLEPDLIILYSGCNDANAPVATEDANKAYRFKDWLYGHSVGWRVVHPGVKRLYFAIAGTANLDPIGLPNLSLPISLPQGQVEELRARIRDRFRANVEALITLVSELGSSVLFVTQSYTLHYAEGCGLQGRWLTYTEELELVTNQYRESGQLLCQQVTLLAHSDMMEALRSMASQAGLPIVDGIAALDRDRHQAMVSPVHLSPVGTRRLAQAIRDVILENGFIPATVPVSP